MTCLHFQSFSLAVDLNPIVLTYYFYFTYDDVYVIIKSISIGIVMRKRGNRGYEEVNCHCESTLGCYMCSLLLKHYM